MQRYEIENYNNTEVSIECPNSYGLYFGLYLVKCSENGYIKNSESFINKLMQWTKDIESNNLPSSLNYTKDAQKSVITILATQNSDNSMINLDVIDSDKNVVICLAQLLKNVFIRKIKSSIYYQFKYKYEYDGFGDDVKFVKKVLSNPFIDTLKNANNGVSILEICKVKREFTDFIIMIDGIEIDTQRTVDIEDLNMSAKEDGGYYFYTCSCGDAGCGGIDYPIQVYRDSDYIYWDLYTPYGGRFKFDKKQYIDEIAKYKEAKMVWDWQKYD
jgi:hypothetical protein